MVDENNNNTNEEKGYKKWLTHNENKWIVFGVGAICMAVFMPFIILALSLNDNVITKLTSLGAVGDFLGGSTVGFLSLASMLFLVSTIVMQKKELQLQRKELELTRGELAKANKQYELTNNTMLKQQFETTLFNMINQHIILVNNLHLIGYEVVGKAVLNKVYSLVETRYMKEEYESFFREFIYYEFDLTKLQELYELHINTKKIIGEEPLSYEKFNDFLSIENLESGVVSFSDLFISCEEIIYLDPNFQEPNLIIDVFDVNFYPEKFHKKLSYDFTKIDTGYVLDNFFDNFINIIEFIEESAFRENQKLNYIKVFISQLSAYEIYMLKTEAVLGDNSKLNEIFEKYEILSDRLQAMAGIVLWKRRIDIFHFNSKRESLVKL